MSYPPESKQTDVGTESVVSPSNLRSIEEEFAAQMAQKRMEAGKNRTVESNLDMLMAQMRGFLIAPNKSI